MTRNVKGESDRRRLPILMGHGVEVILSRTRAARSRMRIGRSGKAGRSALSILPIVVLVAAIEMTCITNAD